jgi:uncharacterized protein (DUF1697 family)
VTAYAGLLRAVNVGGTGKLPMATLRDLATGLGYGEVATLLASGNVVLTAGADARTVSRELTEALSREAGLTTDVIARSRDDLADVVAADVLGDVADDPAKRLVCFLSGAPDPDAVARLDPDEFAPERWAVRGRELTLWCPDGAGRSKLATTNWSRRLGVVMTGRNWRTVTRLLALLDART